MFFFLPGQPRPRPSPLLTGQASGGGGSKKTLSTEGRRGGEPAGPASQFQECFRNVSGGGGEPRREWAQPPPGQHVLAGWGWGAGREALGANRTGLKKRSRGRSRAGRSWEWAGRPPARSPLPAPRPGGTQPCEVPRPPWRERKSPEGGRRGERAEETAGERLGEGWPAPLSGALVGVGRVQGALRHLCALRPASA